MLDLLPCSWCKHCIGGQCDSEEFEVYYDKWSCPHFEERQGKINDVVIIHQICTQMRKDGH